ncbi:VOC family protein [Roseimaritima sediminicola]|uniref:VOC family protein n=1 Tax=Roseimaritima sediminicola TaxID=2662066 RepID=UPI001298539B|nr:VOC family protein [Roseimaritima sediminicola]
MRTLALNHVALHVADVPRSEAFYRDVLQLTAMPRPDFDFPGAWFRLGVDQELHLIGDRTAETQSHPRGTHFALCVDDMDAWEEHLAKLEVERMPRKRRPDGAEQIFVVDPDGHWVELCCLPVTQ